MSCFCGCPRGCNGGRIGPTECPCWKELPAEHHHAWFPRQVPGETSQWFDEFIAEYWPIIVGVVVVVAVLGFLYYLAMTRSAQ